MTTKNIQKRANTKPKAPRKDVAQKSQFIQSFKNLPSSKIVGVSSKGLIALMVLGVFGFNYYLFNEFKSLKSQVAHSAQININSGVEHSFLEKKLEDLKLDIMKTVFEREKVETKVVRAPAAIRVYSDESPIARMGSLDVKKYTVQNTRAFPSYKSFLVESSERKRQLHQELAIIEDDYLKTEGTKGDFGYQQMMAFKDSVLNQHIRAQKVADDKWRRIHLR